MRSNIRPSRSGRAKRWCAYSLGHIARQLLCFKFLRRRTVIIAVTSRLRNEGLRDNLRQYWRRDRVFPGLRTTINLDLGIKPSGKCGQFETIVMNARCAADRAVLLKLPFAAVDAFSLEFLNIVTASSRISLQRIIETRGPSESIAIGRKSNCCASFSTRESEWVNERVSLFF